LQEFLPATLLLYVSKLVGNLLILLNGYSNN